MFLILLVWPWLLCQTIQAVLKGMLTENLIGEGSQGPGDYNEFSDQGDYQDYHGQRPGFVKS